MGIKNVFLRDALNARVQGRRALIRLAIGLCCLMSASPLIANAAGSARVMPRIDTLTGRVAIDAAGGPEPRPVNQPYRTSHAHTAIVRPQTAAAGLTTNDLTDSALTPEILAQTIVGQGIAVSNAHFTGALGAGGTFSGDSSILGLGYGVALSTGSVASIIGPNKSDNTSTDNELPGDPLLDDLSGGPTFDAATLDFDFIPKDKTVSFQYAFGSEEYNEYVYSYNDVFGFFINGQNCATVPGTTLPVSVNSINGGNPYGSSNASHADLYRNNALPDGGGSIDTELDGLTTVLTCVASVNPGVVNHAHLSIADALDHLLDSDVFIKAGSLTNGVPSWIDPTPKDRSVLQPAQFLPDALSFVLKAQAADGPITISHSALPAGLSCADESPDNPGNPAEDDCTFDPYNAPPGFHTVTFNATLDNGVSAGTRTYTIGYGVYSALGDSYAAGEGSSSFDPGPTGGPKDDPCHRSTIHAWEGLLSSSDAPQLPLTFAFDACSGAIIPDIIGGTEENSEIGKVTTNNGHNQGEGIQLNDIGSGSTLVTLSVGGNDVGFAPILTHCLLQSNCRQQDAEVSKTIEGLKSLLPTVYRDIKARAPRARIMIMGYPHAFSLSQGDDQVHSDCYYLYGDDIRWLNEKAKQLDDVIRASVTGSGVAEYIDSYGAFDGHGACDSDSWIHAVELGDVGESFHPRDAGYEALYKIALKQLEQGPPDKPAAYSIYPSQTIEATAVVAPGQDSVAFTSQWPGSNVIMSLTSPSGRVITPTTQAADVDHQSGATYEVYTVTNPEAGKWTISLYGADVSADGETVNLTTSATPHVNAPPIAVYRTPASGTTATGGSPLTFDASASYDTDGKVVSASWDFGDGTSATGTMVDHTFTQTGVYTPLLTIVDDQGAEGFVSNGPITVTSALGSGTPQLPNGAVGVPYTTTLTWSGDQESYYFWAIQLPQGLSLDSDGALHGTPVEAGDVTIAVNAKDEHGGWGTRMYNLTIDPAGSGCTGASCETATPELGSGELLATGLAPLGLALLLRRVRRSSRAR